MESNFAKDPKHAPDWKAKGLDGVRQPGAFADSSSFRDPETILKESEESFQGVAGGTASLPPETRELLRNVKRQQERDRLRLHIILLQILMGDIAGAVRSYGVLMQRDMREFSRAVVEKLHQIRDSRSRVIRQFARQEPPRHYAGEDEAQKARSDRAAAAYSQYVQIATQLMGEFQNTEREFVDLLHDMKRDVDAFWQSYTHLREQDGRSQERVMTVR